MSEDRLDPEMMTVQELVQGQLDGHKYIKIDEIRSEVGGLLSLNAASAVGSASDFSSQLTDTKLMTGRGTLSSAGLKFRVKNIYIENGAKKACTFVLWDYTTKRMQIIVPSAGLNLTDVRMHHFSTDCKVVCGTGPAHVTIGGIAEIVLI